MIQVSLCSLRLTRYLICNHIGRPTALLNGWIRVTEVRGARMEELEKSCPQCEKPGRIEIPV